MLLTKIKMMIVALLTVTAVAAGAILGARQEFADEPAAAANAKSQKTDEGLLGTWTIVSAERGGQKLPGLLVSEGAWTFAAGDKMTARMHSGAKEFAGTYALDPAKKLREITTTIDNKTQPGIYKLAGDTLTICMGDEITKAGNARPTACSSRGDPKFCRLVFVREHA